MYKQYSDSVNEVKKIVIQKRAEGWTWKQIARFLDKREILSPTGLRTWNYSSLCSIALKNGWASRVRGTKSGPKGSTGTNVPAVKRKKKRKSPSTRPNFQQVNNFSEDEVEDIWSSNLDLQLKIKITREVL